jgi:hypothetical protein
MSCALQGYIAARHPYKRAADEIELVLHSRHVKQLQAVSLQQQQEPEWQQHPPEKPTILNAAEAQKIAQQQQQHRDEPLELRRGEDEESSGMQSPLESSTGDANKGLGQQDQQELQDSRVVHQEL